MTRKSALTAKQRKFAENVALGNTGADSYRLAYNSKGKPATVGNHASQLKADDRIKNEIETITPNPEKSKALIFLLHFFYQGKKWNSD